MDLLTKKFASSTRISDKASTNANGPVSGDDSAGWTTVPSKKKHKNSHKPIPATTNDKKQTSKKPFYKTNKKVNDGKNQGANKGSSATHKPSKNTPVASKKTTPKKNTTGVEAVPIKSYLTIIQKDQSKKKKIANPKSVVGLNPIVKPKKLSPPSVTTTDLTPTSSFDEGAPPPPSVVGVAAVPAVPVAMTPVESDGTDFIKRLPYHVVTGRVLSFMEPKDLGRFAQVCKYTQQVCEEGYLWQNKFRQNFPESQLTAQAMKEWKLAYKLSLNNIVEHQRCFHTKRTFFQDILGVGLDYTVNPKTKAVDYISTTQDILSLTAFEKHNVREDRFGNKFKLFLPLYFSEDHFKRALPTIKRTIRRLASAKGASGFHHSIVLDVFPKILTTFAVLVSNEGISASRQSMEGLVRIHRLFLALAHKFPAIKMEAKLKLRQFVESEDKRSKTHCKSLGSILPLLMVLDTVDKEWELIRGCYLQEMFDRSVLWVCRKHPNLESTSKETQEGASKRVDLTRQAMVVTQRVLMLQVYFAYATMQGETTQLCARRYDLFLSELDPDLRKVEPKQHEEVTNDVDVDSLKGYHSANYVEAEGESEANDVASPMTMAKETAKEPFTLSTFRQQVNHILTVDTWQAFFKFVGVRGPPSKADMAIELQNSVRNSAKKGYHTPGMDFSRIHRSGTSKILSKGQEYSASSDLQRVELLDNWEFRGLTKYLDATCLVYQGKKRVATVDYKSRPYTGIVHSGDVIQGEHGQHTIQLDLNVLPKSVTTCVFVVSAWNGATLADIYSPTISLQDNDGTSLCTYNLDSQDKLDHLTSVIMCKFYRSTRGATFWHVQAIGESHRGHADSYGPIYKAADRLV